MDFAEVRTKAEARRQKILARQNDRLSSITGSYAEPEGSASITRSAAQPSKADSAMQQPAVPATTQPRLPEQQQQQQQQKQQQQEQQLAQLMAAVNDSLARAQAASTAVGASPQTLQQDLGALQAAAAALSGSADATASTASAPGSQAGVVSEQQQQQQGVPALLQLGPALSLAVKQTQFVRIVAAIALAYAALSGWGVSLPVPPAVVLVATNLSTVAAALFLVQTTSWGSRMAAKAAAAQSQEGIKMPWHLRGFDPVALVPGLRELLTALSGYQQLANAVSDDTAAYLVALGLITVAVSVKLQSVAVA